MRAAGPVLALVAVLIGAPAPALAQDLAPRADPDRAEELKLNADERKTAAEEMERRAAEAAEAADADEARIKRIAVEIARHETEIAEAREKLMALADEEALAVAALRERRRLHAAAFSAMIALSKAPAPALIAHEGGAAEAARSAALLGGLRDSLTDEARETRRRIARIKDLRAAADGARREAKQAIAALRAREQELWTLVGKRRAEKRARLSEAELLKQEADELAAQAQALSVLLRRSPPPAPKPERAPAPQPATRYLSPPRPLSEARGRFAAPVVGEVSADYSASGRDALGLVFRAKPYSRVYAPWNGVVSYAGPVKSFGLVCVIDIGEGHQIVLAGLASLERRRGDAVLRGEPIGRLAGPVSESDEFLVEHSALDDGAVASLYMQMRKNNEPINPGPWLEKPGL